MPSFLGEPFRYDLFVSYSHGDLDGSGESNLKRWSQAFVRELEGELRLDPSFRDLKIFVDQDLRPDQGVDPMEPLSDQLREEVGRSGILTVLMTPHYLLSSWCRDELEWWGRAQRQHGIAEDGRVAVVRVWPTGEPWPDALTDSRGEQPTGFKFHDERRPQPFEWPDPSGTKGAFRDELLVMVGRLWRNLKQLKSQLEERRSRQAEAERLAAAEGQVVYLHGREEQAGIWTQTKGELDDGGFIVLPGEPDPVVRAPQAARKVSETRTEILSGCDGLLLLGTADGRALDSDLVVVGRNDRNLARARSERQIPCAVINTHGQEIATQDRKTTARRLGIDWIDTSEQDWIADVRSWMVESSREAERAR